MDKPKLVVLCDISGSVAVYRCFSPPVSLCYESAFSRYADFLFVDEISEITADFKTNNVKEAVDRAISQARCSRLGISNFGQVFEMFNVNYGHILDAKTTVIILGDGKNNWYPPRREELQAIAKKVKKLIWLNPEPMEKWNQEDSIIGLYEESCSMVLECRNLEQLERAIRKIM